MRLALATLVLTLAVGVGGTPALASVTPSASLVATPPAFNAGGTYQIFQSNGAAPRLTLNQNAQGTLTGRATYSGIAGTVEQGFVDGPYILLVIAWSNRTKTRYIGSLGTDRRLTGVATGVTNPASHATWRTTRTF
jgi:hypothetical protein